MVRRPPSEQKMSEMETKLLMGAKGSHSHHIVATLISLLRLIPRVSYNKKPVLDDNYNALTALYYDSDLLILDPEPVFRNTFEIV